MRSFHKYCALLLCLLATSCLGELDVKPTENVDQSVVFQTADDLEAGVLGVYAGLGTASITISSLMADENMLPVENNTNKGVQVFSWKQEPVIADIGQAWQNFYMVLDRANRILGKIDNVAVALQDEERRDRLKGELLAIRAYCHFELLRHYAVDYDPASPGIPVMTSSVNGKPARVPVSKVFEQIDADLVAARGLIPGTFTTNTHATALAVVAMQARSALWQERWEQAITHASTVINAMPLSTPAQFADIWLDKSSAEVIWKLKREAQDAKLGDFYREGTRIMYAPAFKLMNAMNASTDVRFSAWFKDLGAGRWAVNKYVGGQPALVNLADVKLLRVAEMYLIRAEAHAATGIVGLVPGTADLNALRAQRISGYTAATFASPQALAAAVMEERYKELAFEGHRYFDLRRKKAAISRIPEDVVQAPSALTSTPADRGYYMPIPLRELQANENMKQHPKYE
ncbi:RagB/SusD family nutrient uptake outer membrane protein [Chitinophaga alhagiae]|uniref:RagB/SusD family nutrient uptake outer membrane protein n=1 Tax=Chitinophaga alhagiae TaxID=2203219 RepID=A0ABM6WCW5_9BACT|nr:RagB/SusD family nutrient uptake outer membrane protein [Chitinophaga alhagiae]AWO01742.1 RagB/SusD family nutrient uptake outer membrane protein [Chitinophaga alhagiae]